MHPLLVVRNMSYLRSQLSGRLREVRERFTYPVLAMKRQRLRRGCHGRRLGLTYLTRELPAGWEVPVYRYGVVSWCGKSPVFACWVRARSGSVAHTCCVGIGGRCWGHAMLGLEDRKRVGRWATALGASCVAVLKLWGTMVRLVRVGVPTIVTTVAVTATRGVLPTVCRSRRACVFAANAVGTTARQHASLPTAVGFAIVDQLA